jgi:hypothetical protein
LYGQIITRVMNRNSIFLNKKEVMKTKNPHQYYGNYCYNYYSSAIQNNNYRDRYISRNLSSDKQIIKNNIFNYSRDYNEYD